MQDLKRIALKLKYSDIHIYLMPVIIGILFSYLQYQFSFYYIVLAVCAISIIWLILKYPIISLILSFSSGIFKDWLTENISLFSSIDFTSFIFSFTLVVLMLDFIRKGALFSLRFPRGFSSLVFFTLFMFATLFYTPSAKYGLLKVGSFFIFNWFLFVFAYWSVQERKDLERFAIFFAAIVGSVSVFTLSMLFRGFLKGDLIYSFRASFLGVNPISFANWIGCANIFYISILLNEQAKAKRFYLLLMVFIFTATMLVSNSRGPIASLMITLFLLGIVNIKRLKLTKLIAALVFVALVIITLFFILPEQVTSRYVDLFGGGTDVVSKTHSAYTINTRLFAWKTAISSATASLPHFLIGMGVGGFSNLFYGLDVRLYPHNMFIEIFCELGVVGLLLIILHFFEIFMPLATRLTFVKGNDRGMYLGFIMASVYLVMAAQFSGDLNDNRRIWFFLGLSLASMDIFVVEKLNSMDDEYKE